MRGLGLVAVLLFLPVFAVRASPEDELPARVTWPELVRIVQARSPKLRAMTATARVAHAEVDVALRIPNPVVSYLGYGRTSGNSQAINGSQHQIEVEQEIPLWGQRRARGEAARAGVELAERSADKLANDVFIDARLTFVALLVAQARQERLSKALDRMNELHTLIEGRVQTGLLGAFDLRLTALELKRFQIARARSAAHVDRLAGELAALVHAPKWAPVALGELTVAAPTVASTAEAPELALARAQEHAAKLNIELISREKLPSLTVKVGAYLTTEGDSSSLLGGVAMPIPSFDTGKAVEERARRESAAASASVASVEAESTVLRAVVERERASLHAAYASFSDGMPEQLQALHAMAEQSYRAGAVGITVLLETLRTAVQAELESLEALHELLVADARARALSGQLLTP